MIVLLLSQWLAVFCVFVSVPWVVLWSVSVTPLVGLH